VRLTCAILALLALALAGCRGLDQVVGTGADELLTTPLGPQDDATKRYVSGNFG
jgi:hypothetical protein